ncbi:HAD-IA family hydrolase [Sphingomonas sp. SUN039]|uniref:HAD-IA family hydrolase n=1 Tax=Sphingomonas sp. SUN039 TaxID=2937787 RepID=UPI002164AF8F|nr:HAD-IA family hydrolase [Sphingomonas sp. SUN039]UVO55020.1 HAD-IA family hydrolase [Sphingomonas sp. SUN039]
MTRLAVFDCDGTLIDSQINICLAMEAAFAQSGIAAPSRGAIRRVVGLSLVEAVAMLLPEAEPALHEGVAADYKRAFQGLRAGGLIDEPLFDGIADVLDNLRDDGWLLGVATGKSDRGLALALDHHGLSDHFVTLQTADRHPSKPHPSMVATAMAEAGADATGTVVIGDTSFDILMALNAGARAVGVAWGYHDAAELIAAGAHALARRPADLTALLEAA